MLKNIGQVLEKHGKKVWIMYNVDNHDRYFCKYISRNLATNSIAIISKEKVYILVSTLDAENVTKLKYNADKVHIIVYESNEHLRECIEDVIADLKFPDDLSLSFSNMGDKNTDVLSHGEYMFITTLFKEPYIKYAKKVKFSSSEEVIYEIESKKTAKQIDRIKYIADITSKILKETFELLKVGMTEIEIANLTIEMTNKITEKYIGKKGISHFKMAWENCPIVLTGENFLKGGHSLPSDKPLKHGDTVYFDFGLKVAFNDGERLYTDIQRMGYVLKKNEKKAPRDVKKVFDTLIKAIDSGMEEMKPNVKAHKIDEVVRSKIQKAGYPDYNHATGHPVGLQVHDIGAVITLKNSKRARLDLIENAIYTLEPRISIANGGSIEEMILVTKYGGVPLCEPQKELYLIK